MSSDDLTSHDKPLKVQTTSSDAGPIRCLTHEATWTSRLGFTFSVLFGLGWLAPIIFLLVWNFQGHEIGAEVGCPPWGCPLNSYIAPYTYQLLYDQYDSRSKDALGALQLVAKALELYFTFVAGSLIWMVMRLMLRGPSGLPTGHLMRHVEFTDPLTMLQRAFWGPFVSRQPKELNRTNKKTGVFLFTLLALVVAGVTNLMSPATAVLVLPSLRWKDGFQIPKERFGGFLNDTTVRIFNCSDSDIRAQNLSCTAGKYGQSLDALAQDFHANLK